MRSLSVQFGCFLIALLCAANAGAASLKDRVQKRLTELGARDYQIYEIADSSVSSALPEIPLVAVRFRQYPLAILPPAPLRMNNLFYEGSCGQLLQASRIDELRALFLQLLPPQKGESGQRDSVKAWLFLSGELKQDGYYTFAIPEGSISVKPVAEKIVVSGKLTVSEGGRGEIAGELTFDDAGKLLTVSESGELVPGIRPICQATKLLDNDPIVRKMAEQDLFVMGPAAKEYLDYIRPKLSPALKLAADRIWKRITQARH